MVLIDHRQHDSANIEGFLAARVGLVREDVAYQGETFLAVSTVGAVDVRTVNMGINSHVPIDGICGHGGPRESLSRRYISVIVVTQQNVACFIDVASPILRLPIGPRSRPLPTRSRSSRRGATSCRPGRSRRSIFSGPRSEGSGASSTSFSRSRALTRRPATSPVTR